jgi:predicted dehydrogenase
VRDSLEAAAACVAAGKHIHLDRPAGTSLPQFGRPLDAAAGKKLVVQMGDLYRYDPALFLIRQALSRGWLGEPFEVHAVMSEVVEPAERREPAAFPGGMMFELGPPDRPGHWPSGQT